MGVKLIAAVFFKLLGLFQVDKSSEKSPIALFVINVLVR